VQSGKALSTALSHEELADPLSLSLIRAGEMSGALNVALDRLATYREQVEAARSQLLSAMTYPLILICVAIVSLFSLMTFVIPRFVPLFEDAGESLPVLTRVVFFLAKELQRFWWLAPLLLASGLLIAERWLVVPRNRLRLHSWLLRAPVVGQVVLLAETARFARTLATLVRNGLPLLGALKLAKSVLRNVVLVEAIEQCVANVRAGARLTESLRQEGAFPALAVDLIAVGEESGQLEDMLDRVADAFESKVQQQLKRLLTLLEPALILGLGAVIAIVIVAILLAMLGLNDLVV
jgi:general secretion pathway protein F